VTRAELRALTSGQRLDLIAAVVGHADTDENLGDVRERNDAIMWVATAGERGDDWGIASWISEHHGIRPVATGPRDHG
jgi:hypothetical protein